MNNRYYQSVMDYYKGNVEPPTHAAETLITAYPSAKGEIGLPWLDANGDTKIMPMSVTMRSTGNETPEQLSNAALVVMNGWQQFLCIMGACGASFNLANGHGNEDYTAPSPSTVSPAPGGTLTDEQRRAAKTGGSYAPLDPGDEYVYGVNSRPITMVKLNEFKDRMYIEFWRDNEEYAQTSTFYSPELAARLAEAAHQPLEGLQKIKGEFALKVKLGKLKRDKNNNPKDDRYPGSFYLDEVLDFQPLSVVTKAHADDIPF